MTPTEAIELLKNPWLSEESSSATICISQEQHAALLAMLDGLRWRSVRDGEVPVGQLVLLVTPTVSRRSAMLAEVRKWHGDDDQYTTYADDLWLTLESILPPAPGEK